MDNSSSNKNPSFDDFKLIVQHRLRMATKGVEEVAFSTNEVLNEIERARAKIQEYDKFRNMLLTLDGNMEDSLTELDSRVYERESVIARQEQMLEKVVDEQSKILLNMQMVYEDLYKMEKAEAEKKVKITNSGKKYKIANTGKTCKAVELVGLNQDCETGNGKQTDDNLDGEVSRNEEVSGEAATSESINDQNAQIDSKDDDEMQPSTFTQASP